MPRRPKLHRHKTGQWRARVNGRDRYYGTDYQKAAARFYRDLADSHPIDAEEATVVDAVLYYQGLRPESIFRRNQLKPFLIWDGARLLRKLPKSYLSDYANWLVGRKYSPATVIGRTRMARAALCCAREMGWLNDVPPMPKLERPAPKYRDLPPARIAEIVQKTAKSNRPWYANVLRFVVATGCRPGEACKMRWEWIDLVSKVCRVPTHKTMRYAKVRVIYLTPAAESLLRTLGPKAEGPVFTSPSGKPVTVRTCAAFCRSYGFYLYQLRHSFAQQAREQGVALDELQVLLGHSNIATTQIYAQVRDARAAAVAGSLKTPGAE